MWEDKPHLPDTMTFLYNEKRFADLIIFEWAMVEVSFTIAAALEFGLHEYDERTDFLEESLNFETKRKFLDRRGLSNGSVLTKEERKAIQLFQEFRNNIFHDLRASQFGHSPDVKKKLMLLAIEAKDASDKLRSYCV